jgi:hypothetical protein
MKSVQWVSCRGNSGSPTPNVCLGRNYLGLLATPIDCAATAYQELDLNETFLFGFFGLDFFAGCTTELFLVAFLDIVTSNDPSRTPPYTRQPSVTTQDSTQGRPCRSERKLPAVKNLRSREGADGDRLDRVLLSEGGGHKSNLVGRAKSAPKCSISR